MVETPVDVIGSAVVDKHRMALVQSAYVLTPHLYLMKLRDRSHIVGLQRVFVESFPTVLCISAITHRHIDHIAVGGIRACCLLRGGEHVRESEHFVFKMCAVFVVEAAVPIGKAVARRAVIACISIKQTAVCAGHRCV